MKRALNIEVIYKGNYRFTEILQHTKTYTSVVSKYF